MTLSPKDNPQQIFPDDVLEDVNSRWRAAHVKSRREKALAHFLAKESIGYYLPMYSRKQAGAQRVRYSLAPVFSGYLFLRADDRQRHTAVRSNHIARVIDVYDSKEFLSELNRVRIALSSGMPVHPHDFLNKGDRARVKNGPFQDLEGVVVRRKNSCRLVLSVTSIMRSISVEIDADQLEPLR